MDGERFNMGDNRIGTGEANLRLEVVPFILNLDGVFIFLYIISKCLSI